MSDYAMIARPYALAVFKLAREEGNLKHWSEVLGFAAAVARDPSMAALIHSPRASADELATLFIDICGKRLSEHAENLIRLLAVNGRLTALPNIAEFYEQFRTEAEGMIEAELISAKPVDDAQQKKIAAALKSKLGRDITLHCTTDATLIGGAVIRAGDMVIDGSVRGRLEKLAGALTQ